MISEGVSTYELELVSDVLRKNRVRVTFSEDCSDFNVDILENYNNMCYNHDLPPCATVEGEIQPQNCVSRIRWEYNGAIYQIGEQVVCQ